MRGSKVRPNWTTVACDVRLAVVEEAGRMEEAGLPAIEKLSIIIGALRLPRGGVVFDARRQLKAECEELLVGEEVCSRRASIMQRAAQKHIQGVDIDDVYTSNGDEQLINLGMLALLDNTATRCRSLARLPPMVAYVTLMGARAGCDPMIRDEQAN